MKVKIIPLAPPMTFEQFAEAHDLTMEVIERNAEYIQVSGAGRYCASFENADTKSGPVLSGTFGNGGTPEEAIANYADELRGKLLVIWLGHHWLEIQCPNEWQVA